MVQQDLDKQHMPENIRQLFGRPITLLLLESDRLNIFRLIGILEFLIGDVRDNSDRYLDLKVTTMADIISDIETKISRLGDRSAGQGDVLEHLVKQLRSAWTEVGQEDLFEKAV